MTLCGKLRALDAIMGSNTKSLSLMHLAIARVSHLAFAIQGDP